MARLTIGEQAQLAHLATDRARRSVLSRVLRSRLLLWQFGAPVADEILLVPQELRTADPSFADELKQGLFGLGGAVAHIGDGSVFELPAPSKAWAEELHGFGWLRNLRAAQSETSWQSARSAVLEWIARYPQHDVPAWTPHVTGRRITSWLANSEMLLGGVDQATYDTVADSLGEQLIQLSAQWRDVSCGYPRLISLSGLVYGSLCIAGHDELTSRSERFLVQELERQLLADGGHVSRNPAIVVELLLDLLPLRTCFFARDREVPVEIENAILRMLRFLRHMRLGDGGLGRFNGMGATPSDSVATLLGYDAAPERPLTSAIASHYSKLARGETIILADVGPPPPLEYAGQASAGCLSFELSIGRQAVFVNGGAPGPAEQDWFSASRATASHNTLVLGSTSSSQLVRNSIARRLIGSPPIRYPAHAWGRITDHIDEITLDAEHDGYLQQFQLLHQRQLKLNDAGTQLVGEDKIASPGTATRLPRDIPFSVHFRLHPNITSRMGEEPGLVTIQLPDGGLWYFRSEKATISLEDSVHFADFMGPQNSQQIVLRGSCFGDTVIRWSFERLGHVETG